LNSTRSTTSANTSLSFPLVYSALVPRPVELQDALHLLSEVDLLHVDQQDCSDDRSKCRIYFLVHSPNELSFLSSFPQSLNYEPEKTRALLEPPVHDARILQSSIYSTIANFPCYNDLQGSLAWMRDLVQTSYSIPNLHVSRIDIGDSFLKTKDQTKGYDIYALKITGKSNNGTKSVMLAMSGIHPREYAPPELLQRWATQLVEGYGVDADITAILDHAEIHLIIQLNPDGRALAETTQPWRRKNLNEANAQSCGEDETGVDLNRNFPFQWGRTLGSSSRYCAQDYRGISAASEPETLAIVNYALSIFPTPQRQTVNYANPTYYPIETTSGIFIDVHSYGEVIIWVRNTVPCYAMGGCTRICDAHTFFLPSYCLFVC
jgi:carboxypeptidase T